MEGAEKVTVERILKTEDLGIIKQRKSTKRKTEKVENNGKYGVEGNEREGESEGVYRVPKRVAE